MKLNRELPWINIINTPYVGYQVYDHDVHKYFWIFTTKDHIKELEDAFTDLNHIYNNYQFYVATDSDDDDYWVDAGEEFDRRYDDFMKHLPKYISITPFADSDDFDEVWPEQEEPDPDDPYYDEYDYETYLYRENGTKVRYNIIHVKGKTYEIEILDDKDVSS